ncbi:MAG: IPT/TIG domain-containing protein, partial [Planctomycetota bacterium]
MARKLVRTTALLFLALSVLPGCAIGLLPVGAAVGIGMAMQDTEEETVIEPEPTNPEIAAVVPSSGPLAGSTSIQVFGQRFVSGATVTIGGTAATNVTFVSATEVTCDTPAGATGPADVVVTN